MQFGLIEAVRHWAKYRRSEIALVSNGDSTTYSELFERCESVARAVLQSSSPSDRVAVVSQRKLLFLSALLGVMRAGCSTVVLNPTLSDDVLGVVVSDTRPTLLVQDRSNAAVWTPDAFSGCSRLIVEDVASDSNAPWPSYAATDEWGIVFSSGSTGVPKGIERSHDSMVAEVLGWCLELSIKRGSTFYVGRPLFYTGGLVLALATLFAGATLVANDYEDPNDPEEVWADYQRELDVRDIELAFFVPDQLRDFTRRASETAAGSRVRHAETILVMGSPISGDEKQAARRALESSVVESWGNSESLGTITEIDDLDRRPGSIGRPFLTDELFVIDSSRKPCKPYERGRLAGSQTAGFSQYANHPKATSLVKQDGRINSDDIGYYDDEGYFYLEGREQEVVVRNGEGVWLPRVAAKIRACDQVEAAEVVAIAIDGDADVELRAAVVLATGYDIEAAILCDRLNEHLATQEQLSRITVLDAIPLLGTGKVDRQAVLRRCDDETDE